LIVIDASAVLELLLQTEKGILVSDVVLSLEERLHAPDLIDIEVTQALRRLTLGKALAVRRAAEALTAYDGVYVALAEALDAPLLTCDARLSGAHGHRARITPI
jgi:predicted nucleic acid-binding protein